MSHHYRFLRHTVRLFTLDFKHIKPCPAKRLGNVCGYCGADAGNAYHHSVNCLSQLPALEFTDTWADLRTYWKMGYDLKEEVSFSSNGTHYAYLMGHDCRGICAEKTTDFVQRPIPA